MQSQSVIDTLNSRLSIRNYIDRKIEDEMLDTILNSARRSPTSSNMQSYSFIVVRDQKKKRELAKLAGNQKHIETCDTFVAICADTSRLENACNMHGKSLGKGLETTLVATVDASLAGMSLSLAAESYGLGTVMIGGMRNHPDKVAELLCFPKGVYVVFGMCIGWPDNDKKGNKKPRMDETAIIHREQYDTSDMEKKLNEYDNGLAEHYRGEGRETPDAAYTAVIANKFNQPRRTHLKGTLEELGFKLD